MSRERPHIPRDASASDNGDGDVGPGGVEDVLLDRLAASLRDAPVPDGPDELTLAATLAALRAAAATPNAQAPHGPFPITQPQRKRIMKPLFKLALAACLVLAAGVVFLAAPWGNSLAFARVVDQVKQAGSVRYRATTTVTMPDGKTRTAESTTLVIGNRLRQELPHAVQLIDFESGEMLVLQPDEKKAMRFTMKNMPRKEPVVNLLDEFRVIDPKQAKDVGVRAFDGRTLHGFVVKRPGQEMTVWADPKTQSPVRIETTIDMPTVPHSTAVMTDFVWGAAGGLELTLEVPEGYKVQSLEMDVSPPAEDDLVEALRTLATLNGGKFPASLDQAAMAGAIKARLAGEPGKTRERAEAVQAELMPKIVAIGRGLSFVTPANGEDWRYAGEGAQLDEPGRPVLWYKPAGAGKHRVIFADLTVRDAAAGELPGIESHSLKAGPTPFPTTQPVKR